MKTLMTLLLTLAMLFTLAACGSQAGGDQTQEPNQSDVLDGDVSGGEEENYESLYGKVTSIVGNPPINFRYAGSTSATKLYR